MSKQEKEAKEAAGKVIYLNFSSFFLNLKISILGFKKHHSISAGEARASSKGENEQSS